MIFAPLLFAIFTAGQKPFSPPKDFAVQADRYMTAWAQGKRFSGAVLVAYDGKPIFRKAYGFADWQTKRPMTPETPCLIFSVTKSFTAGAILLLQDRKLLSVNDPVSKYMPGWPDEWKSVTLHHLLTHTSGLDFQASYNWVQAQKSPLTKLFSGGNVKPLLTKPGTEFEYSNMGYVLLAMVVRKVSGIPFEEFVQKNIFDPLGMTGAGAGGFQDGQKSVARGHDLTDGKFDPGDQPLDSIIGAGDLHANVDDMLKWCLALDGTQLLSKASRDAMHRPWIKNGDTSYYGYGWDVDPVGKVFEHSGGGGSFIASVWRLTDKKLVMIMLRNIGPGFGDMPSDQLVAMALGKSVRKPQFADFAAINAYQGQYLLRGQPKMTVSMEGGDLHATWASGPNVVLDFAGGTKFRGLGVTVEFLTQPTGSYVARIVVDGEKPILTNRREVSTAELESEAGEYRSGLSSLKVGRKGGRLVSQGMTYFSIGKDRYRDLRNGTELFFIRENGKVRSVKLSGNGTSVVFRRL